MSSLNKNDHKIFAYFSFFWLAVAWLAFVLALFGFFYRWLLVIFISTFVLFGTKFFLKSILKISRTFLVINLILISTIAIFSFFSNPTVFSGRDQASLSQASVRLTQFNQLEFSTSVSDTFFKVNSLPKKKMISCLNDRKNVFPKIFLSKTKLLHPYCQAISAGKALNFPGFYYTTGGKLVTQFPLVYISWLALFFTFFGLNGFIIANAILFYIFALSFYFIFYKISKKSSLSSAIALGFILTSFSFMWFFKFTLSENIMLAFLWLGILQIVILTRSKLKKLSSRKINLALLFLSLGILIFTRIEGVALFIVSFSILLFNKNSRNYFQKNFVKLILPFLIFLFLIFIWNTKVNIYFYKTIVKAIFSNLTSVSNSENSFFSSAFNLLQIFVLYGILLPLLFGLIQIFYLLKNKKFQQLIPFLIVTPIFIYLFNPQITPDHPWMLRRFVFAILPASFLYSTLFVNNLLRKNYKVVAGFITFLILVFNLYPFVKYLTFRPGESLLSTTQKISQNFSAQDLILIDRMVTGDNWQMIADPMNSLFHKNAVYFFNPNDFAKIDTEKYAKIYLITPTEKIDYYKHSIFGNKLIPLKNYSIKLTILNNNGIKNISLPNKRTLLTTGTIFEIQK